MSKYLDPLVQGYLRRDRTMSSSGLKCSLGFQEVKFQIAPLLRSENSKRLMVCGVLQDGNRNVTLL